MHCVVAYVGELLIFSFIPETGRTDYGNDLEVNEITPASSPKFQVGWIGRLHELKAAPACLVDPASVI